MTSWFRCLLNIFESEHAHCQKSDLHLEAFAFQLEAFAGIKGYCVRSCYACINNLYILLPINVSFRVDNPRKK